MLSSVAFIENLDASSLSMDKSEFDMHMKQAEEARRLSTSASQVMTTHGHHALTTTSSAVQQATSAVDAAMKLAEIAADGMEPISIMDIYREQ